MMKSEADLVTLMLADAKAPAEETRPAGTMDERILAEIMLADREPMRAANRLREHGGPPAGGRSNRTYYSKPGASVESRAA